MNENVKLLLEMRDMRDRAIEEHRSVSTDAGAGTNLYYVLSDMVLCEILEKYRLLEAHIMGEILSEYLLENTNKTETHNQLAYFVSNKNLKTLGF